MEEKIEQLKKIVEKSQKIVFFGGAGVSTESGIPDFRSVDGLYNQKWAYPPETIERDFFSFKSKGILQVLPGKTSCIWNKTEHYAF